MAWSDLPVDLIRCISSLLPIVHFVRFSAVCTTWNSVLANNDIIRVQCRPSPWRLFLNDVGEASNTLTFRDITIEDNEDNESRDSHHCLSSSSSHTSYGWCLGSNDGWLVAINEKDLQPHLFNPITKAELSLPSLMTIPGSKLYDTTLFSQIKSDNYTFYKNLCYRYFQKIVLSSNNSSGTAVLIYNYNKSLALARPGDRAWVLGPSLSPYHLEHYDDGFDDAYFNEEEHMFYVITQFSAILTFNHDGQNVKIIYPTIQNQDFNQYCCGIYIGFLSGTLIKIERSHSSIHVFKFVSAGVASSSQWIPIKDLEGYSLFIGRNQTFSINCTVVPEIKPNCIYFTDPWSNFIHDVGLFDLHNKYFQYFQGSDLEINWAHAVWFTPSFS